MNISDLIQSLDTFNKDRDWSQFHSPKNLIMALTGEVGELSEIFQWLTLEESDKIMETAKAKQVEEELADVFLYLLNLSNRLDVDLLKVAAEKLEQNQKKYPVDKVKGSAKKYNEL